MLIKKIIRGDVVDKIIIYGSYYGSTKRYAMELSKRTGIQAKSYEEVKDLSSYSAIIYMGGLYAGGVLGLSKTIKLISPNSNQTIIIATVGLADPKDKANTDSIKGSIKKQVPTDVYEKANIIHLRGGIDYSVLSFKHKAMMKVLYTMIKNTPEEKQSADTKGLIETYNQVVDFVDFDSLNEIINLCSFNI